MEVPGVAGIFAPGRMRVSCEILTFDFDFMIGAAVACLPDFLPATASPFRKGSYFYLLPAAFALSENRRSSEHSSVL